MLCVADIDIFVLFISVLFTDRLSRSLSRLHTTYVILAALTEMYRLIPNACLLAICCYKVICVVLAQLCCMFVAYCCFITGVQTALDLLASCFNTTF